MKINFGPWESIYIKPKVFYVLKKKNQTIFMPIADIYFTAIFDDFAILQEAL
jgi:hypothetical protein